MSIPPFGTAPGSKIKSGLDINRPATSGSVNNYYYATDTQILYYSDGSKWQFATDMSDAMSGPQPSQFPNETMIIAPGAASTVLTASGGAVVSQDTTDYVYGTQSIKMVSAGNGSSNLATISLGTPIDLSQSVLVLAFKVDSFTPYNDFQVRLSSDNFASANFDYFKPAYTGASQRWVEGGKWTVITINRGAAVGNMSSGQYLQNGTGIADYKSVNAIRFKLVDNGGSAPVTVHLGYLSYFSRPQQGMVSMTFDDSRATHFTVAKPIMDVYRMRGTSYTIAAEIGASGAYMTQAQVKSLQQDSNWEIGAHAYTDTTGVNAHNYGYDSLTTHDGEIDILQLRTWLRQNQSQGINHLALPHGQWSLNLQGISSPNPDVLGMMGKYFNTVRTTYANTIETYPAANRLKLRAYVVGPTDTAATIMAMINAAIANKWWLILTFHNLVASPSQSTDFSISEFNSLVPQIASSGVAVKTIGEVWRMQNNTLANPQVVKSGTGTLSGGTATISTPAVTSASVVLLTDTSSGTNIGTLSVGTITSGTSFVVNSSNVLDTSTFNWAIVN